MGQGVTPETRSLMNSNSGSSHVKRASKEAAQLATQISANHVSEAQEIENNFLKYNKLAPWKENDKSMIEEEGLIDYSDTGQNENDFMNTEFMELNNEH